MNCREAELEIFADRIGEPGGNMSSALNAHLSACPACRRKRDSLAMALERWKEGTRSVAVPDVHRAWSDLRCEIRGGTATATPPGPLLSWLAMPLVATAALALMLVSEPRPPGTDGEPTLRQVARAEFVEVPSSTASTVVFVDDTSGWLVVWATDTNGTRI